MLHACPFASAGTEKQRDDALEALVLQQEIAEELERERKRNKKELSALQHTNVTSRGSVMRPGVSSCIFAA